MPSEPPTHPEENSLVIRPSTGLVKPPDGGSSAMTEIISRSLVHIQTSQSLAVPERRAGKEQEFEIAPGVKIVMCWIQPGEFLMGSPEDEIGRNSDETQHRVNITQGFWLGKYQVTQAQWEAVMGNNPSHHKGSDLPVENVSWNDISKTGGFLEKANSFASTEVIYSLPTEAQWEYACRAGTTTALNNGKNLTSEDGVCPNLDVVAWYNQNSGNRTHPVGQKQANAWGLHDMHGNGWEICTDGHQHYKAGSIKDPCSSCLDGFRIIRGGSPGAPARYCRSSGRVSGEPDDSAYGFRLSRSSDFQKTQPIE